MIFFGKKKLVDHVERFNGQFLRRIVRERLIDMSLVDWLILSTRSIVAQYQNGIQKYSLDFDKFEFSFKKMCPSLVDKSSGTRFNWSSKHNQDRNISRDF